MTLKESYQSAYARKNQAVSAQYKSKKATLSAKKKRLEEQGQESLRAAYAEYMRASAAAEQQNRAEGRFGGAAENQKAGQQAAHVQKRESIQADTAADVASVEQQLSSAAALKDKKIADNETALQQKLDSLAIKEDAAAKSSKGSSGSGKSSSSSGKVSKSQAISLMKMGIYDASFAEILGIPDQEVRDFIAGLDKKKSTDTDESVETRLPGTYKPPLR